MPYLTLSQNRKIHFTDTLATTPTSSSSSSKTLILIHGLGSSQNYYLPLLPALSAHNRVILFDTYGAGRSHIVPGLEFEQSVESIAEDVLSVLEMLGVRGNQGFVVVGHSMGGMVVSHLMDVAKGKVEAGVAIGPVLPGEQVKEMFEGRIKVVGKDGLEPLANTIPRGATGSRSTPLHHAFIRELILSQSPAGYISSCNVIANATPPNYAAATAPFLLIAGKEDKAAPLANCEKIFGQVGSEKKRMEVLEGVGHWHAIEAPEEVGRLIVEFVDGL